MSSPLVSSLCFGVFLMILIYEFLAVVLLVRSQEAGVPSSAACPDGSWIPTDTYGRCLKVFFFQEDAKYRDKGSWVDGMQMCAENGAVLATLHNQYEDRIAHMIVDSLPNSCWIGLRRYILKRPQRGWIWVDQDTSLKEDSFMAWGDELKLLWHVVPPEEKCGEISNDGWGELPCWGVSSKLRCSVCSTLTSGEEGLPSTSLVSMSGIKNLWRAPPTYQPTVRAPIQMPDSVNRNWRNVIASSDFTRMSHGSAVFAPSVPVNLADPNLYYVPAKLPQSFLAREPSAAIIVPDISNIDPSNVNLKNIQGTAIERNPSGVQDANMSKYVEPEAIPVHATRTVPSHFPGVKAAIKSENQKVNSDFVLYGKPAEDRVSPRNFVEQPYSLDTPVAVPASTGKPNDADSDDTDSHSIVDINPSAIEGLTKPASILPNLGNASGDHSRLSGIFMASQGHSPDNVIIENVASGSVPWKWARAAPYENAHVESYDAFAEKTADITNQALPDSSRIIGLSVKNAKPELLLIERDSTSLNAKEIKQTQSDNISYNNEDHTSIYGPEPGPIGGLVISSAVSEAGTATDDFRNEPSGFLKRWSSGVMILIVVAVVLGLILCCCGIAGMIVHKRYRKRVHKEAFLNTDKSKYANFLEKQNPQSPNSADETATLDTSSLSGYAEANNCNSNQTSLNTLRQDRITDVESLSTGDLMGGVVSIPAADVAQVALDPVSHTFKISGNYNNRGELKSAHGDEDPETSGGSSHALENERFDSIVPHSTSPPTADFNAVHSCLLALPTFRPLLKQEGAGTCPRSPSSSPDNEYVSDKDAYEFHSTEPGQPFDSIVYQSLGGRNKTTNLDTAGIAASLPPPSFSVEISAHRSSQTH